MAGVSNFRKLAVNLSQPDLLLRHPERFKPLQPQSSGMRALATLVEHRRQLVGEKIRVTNRLRSALKQYYPQALDWFDHIDTLLFCDFLTRWPTLIQAKRARATTLRKFFGEHNMHRHDVLDRRLKSIKISVPLTLDEAIIVSYRLQALVLIGQLRLMLQSIKEFDEEIESIASKHPDYALFRALPGAGPSLAPNSWPSVSNETDSPTCEGSFVSGSSKIPGLQMDQECLSLLADR